MKRDVGLLAIILACSLLGCTKNKSGETPPGAVSEKSATAEARTHNVTPVRGPSWLKRLGLAVSDTRAGEMGGLGPIPPTRRREPEMNGNAPGSRNDLTSVMKRFLSLLRSSPQQASQIMEESFTLAGADLYRLNCQSCHAPDGKGAPPEINSLIGPVQGTSAALIEKRMNARGTPIDEEMAKELGEEARTQLLERLQKGGEKMPPFEHLRGDEVEALLGYLQKLAGVPTTRSASRLVPESAARVGEHLVKGTCHICHDATGPGGGHMAMMQGIIPSLASFPNDQSLSGVIHQVQYGSSGMMMMGGVRMPPMPYFTEEETAAAYFYLVEYPPRP
jgi:mono/diheme cytochrome c family protein